MACYDDVSLEDAPYFSALYGEARHAIVVRDLEAVKAQLETLDDCPDDLYLIEGDPIAFDDAVFSADELNEGVVVKVSERHGVIRNSLLCRCLVVPLVKNVLKH